MSILTRALAASILVAPSFSQVWTSSHPVQPGWTIRYAAAVAEQAGDNQIFMFGGITGLSSVDSVWRYHRTNGWFVMGNMPAGRHDTVAATVNVGGQDYVQLIGGGAGATAASTTNWRYDVNADTWNTSLAPMPGARANMEAVTAPNGLVYVFGGNDANGGTTYSSLFIYDPVADSWSTGPAMPRARRNFAALKDCDGYIYLYGGNAGATTHAEVDCFDTVTHTWLSVNPHTGGAIPNMITPRTNVAGALARNGRHYLTGGNVASPVAVPTVESFDPYTNSWATEPSLLESRNQHRALGLGSRVWVPGGYRKIWPTTNRLESFGSLGAYGPCGDDVALLPPPVIATTFASAIPLELSAAVIGGQVDPDVDHYFSIEARANVLSFVDVNVEDDEDGIILTVYDDSAHILSENSASEGFLLDPSGLQTQRFYLRISNGHGIGSSGYDLYVSSTDEPQPIGEVYCSAATPNSSGERSGIRALGLASTEANSIELQVASLPTMSFGYFLVSPEAGTIANPGGSQGTLCLTGFQIGRYAGNVLNAGDTGEVALPIDLTSIPGSPASVGAPGDRWYFTYWHRDADPVAGSTSNFSDGVCIELR